MRAQEKCLYIDCFGSGPKEHECYSAIKKNTFESVLMRWMKLEPIIQSEVSQKEKLLIVLREDSLSFLHLISYLVKCQNYHRPDDTNSIWKIQ